MAKQKDLKFVVVTPEKKVVEDAADSIVIPMHDGELGILPDRAPLMCALGVGQMRYSKAGKTSRLYIDGGFAQVHGNNVTLLTEHAVPANEITNEMVSEAEKRAADEAAHRGAAAESREQARRRASALRDLQSSK